MHKGNAALLLIGGGKPKGMAKDDDKDDAEESDDAGLELAMADFSAAAKKGDTKAMTAAFKSAMDCYGGGGDD